MKTTRLGLLGLGTVGSGLVDLLEKGSASLCHRLDTKISVVRALVRDGTRPRRLPASMVTTDPAAVIETDDVDMVVELMGGIEPARSYILRALAAGKPVVTANKAVLAQHGAELLAASHFAGRPIGFEASVCGGIPLLRAISTGLIADEVEQMVGILNGTSNFILSKMHRDGLDYASAVALAQERGLAEADPTLDVNGSDAAHKLILLSELMFQTAVGFDQIEREGIESIEPIDIQTADDFGYVIKPVAVAKRVADALDLRVHPALVPYTHVLGPVSDEYNAVLLRGDATGETLFYGRGAGSLPTASAVLGDIVELVRHPDWRIPWDPAKSTRVRHVPGESRFYLRFPVDDRPGLIGKVATALGDRGVSISHAQARLIAEEGAAGNLTILTHATSEPVVSEVLHGLEADGAIRAPALSLRILD
ncbi:MAG: homoserine dehydrogenase [Fimbriimonadaceae bacterium]